MSDEKLPVEFDRDVRIQEGNAVEPRTAKPTFTPAVLLAFAGAAVLGALVVMSIKNSSQPDAASDPEIAAIQAEIDAHRAGLNSELIAMGRTPIASEGEPTEDIAARLGKDAAALVALAGSFQETIARKDAEITASQSQLLESEKLRQSLSSEIARINADLRQARIEASAADLLRRDLATAQARNEAVAAELANARSQLSKMDVGVPAADFADLQRRYDETLRAKEFYEDQVKQLQAGGAKAD